MATYEVSTWAELVTAANTARNSGDVIKLIADIDCNYEIPTGVSSTVVIWQSSITIDGSYTENGVTKNHVIINLRTDITSPQPIFKFIFNNTTITHTVKNIDFVNVILNAPLFQVQDYYLATHYFYVKNCRFTGKRYDYLISRLAGQSSGAQGYVNNYLQHSYFNVPYYGTSETKIALCQYFYDSSAYFYNYADNCRIRVKYNGTYEPTYSGGRVMCEIYNINLSGCRIEGDIVGMDTDVTNLNFYIQGGAGSRTPSMQNVYDVDFYMKNVVRSRNVSMGTYKGVVKTPAKNWDDKTITYSNYVTPSTSSGIILATESQMQDTDWLIQHNFDVVPSNT